MLDLPELLEKVFQHLNRHDLAQCARVNKQWHALTIPHIWRDLEYACWGNKRTKAFHRTVLEDYLQENGYQEGPRQSSVLSKYGHLIRLLPNPRSLLTAFQTQECTQQSNEPTAHELLLHLFKRSSKAQIDQLVYTFMDPESDEMKAILAFTLPRLRYLDIQASIPGIPSKLIKFKTLLDQCSIPLKSLHVDISILRIRGMVDIQNETTEDESICWTSLKNLTLLHVPDMWDTGPFWSWMLKRCGQMERLHVKKIDKSTASLVQAMLAYTPNLQNIIIGASSLPNYGESPKGDMEDDIVAALLSGSRHGWKTINIDRSAKLGQKTMNALALHYSTLEELRIYDRKGLPSRDLVQVLRSCPHLRTFYYGDHRNGRSGVDGMAFIDLDPNTGLLKPWLCEGSLKAITVKISGIPRPDSGNESVVAEAYPGQGREIQSQVYDRIARLTHLDTLKLGYRTDRYIYDPSEITLDLSLEMSLESGLDKLSGLKSLKELGVEGLATEIGTQEVQWMLENWPKLRDVLGLDWREMVEAVKQLRENPL